MKSWAPVLLLVGLCGVAVAGQAAEKIKVVVVTGGHGFEHDPFFQIFKEIPDIEYVEAAQRNDSEIFEDISPWLYDVMVLYNLSQNISEKRRENLLKLLDKGVGVVALHHNLGSFQTWPEYERIIGGRFYMNDLVVDGVKHPRSAWREGLDYKVQIADKDHPITRGVADFEIKDETYGKFSIDPQVHVLLTTDEPSSEKTIGWVKTYRKSPVCYLLNGHGSAAYANPNYRRLVAQAIRWAAGRPPEK